MKIDNVKVYDLEESIVASGLPMLAEYDETEFGKAANELRICHLTGNIQDNPHFKRACKLAANPAGSGHNNFLSGILISFDVTASQVWWMQMERYHFVQIVSSMSKMHRLRKMVMEGNKYPFAPGTDEDAVCLLHCLGGDEDVNDVTLAYSCPMGLELTARITTNYLQLKTIFSQRKNHKLPEWLQFREFIKSLPFAKEFIIGKEN